MGDAEEALRQRRAASDDSMQQQQETEERQRARRIQELSVEVDALAKDVLIALRSAGFPGGELFGRKGLFRRQWAGWEVCQFERRIRSEWTKDSIHLLSNGTFIFGWQPEQHTFVGLCAKLRDTRLEPESIRDGLKRILDDLEEP
jgi:hypothetical protein